MKKTSKILIAAMVFPIACLASIHPIENLENYVPGTVRADASGWHYANSIGFYHAVRGVFPWTYLEDSGWWYATESGWWYGHSMKSGGTGNSTVTQEQLDQIHDVLEASMAYYEIPGVAYAIKFAGQPAITGALGVKDLETQEPLHASDRFRIGSASKTFTGMAILQLLDRQLIGIDHPISNYLPDDLLVNYDRDTITIRMLLQHTSGIASYTNIIEEWNLPYIFEREKEWTKEELVELVDGYFSDETPGYGMTFDPGDGWSYSNTNTVLLGLIVENVTGRSIHNYINYELVGALGLTNTYYPAPGESVIEGEHTKGYMDWVNFTGADFVPAGMTDVTVYDASGVGPAGPIISNVEDLCTWIEALAYNRMLISKDWQQLHVNTNGFISFMPTIPSVSYGFQLVKELDQEHQSAIPNIAHRGQISGYDTVMIHLSEVDCSIAMMSNRTLPIVNNEVASGLEVGVYAMFEILFPEMLERYSYGDSSTMDVGRYEKVKNTRPKTSFQTRALSEY
jgi:D-alanyl-D-alanine carboxypeptidase